MKVIYIVLCPSFDSYFAQTIRMIIYTSATKKLNPEDSGHMSEIGNRKVTKYLSKFDY